MSLITDTVQKAGDMLELLEVPTEVLYVELTVITTIVQGFHKRIGAVLTLNKKRTVFMLLKYFLIYWNRHLKHFILIRVNSILFNVSTIGSSAGI